MPLTASRPTHDAADYSLGSTRRENGDRRVLTVPNEQAFASLRASAELHLGTSHAAGIRLRAGVGPWGPDRGPAVSEELLPRLAVGCIGPDMGRPHRSGCDSGQASHAEREQCSDDPHGFLPRYGTPLPARRLKRTNLVGVTSGVGPDDAPPENRGCPVKVCILERARQ